MVYATAVRCLTVICPCFCQLHVLMPQAPKDEDELDSKASDDDDEEVRDSHVLMLLETSKQRIGQGAAQHI